MGVLSSKEEVVCNVTLLPRMWPKYSSHSAVLLVMTLIDRSYTTIVTLSLYCTVSMIFWGTAAAAPPPFRPGEPALCGSHPLVTPY